MSLEVSDGVSTKNTSVALRKDILNALKIKKSTDNVIYFSYPSADNDVIHITNNTDKLYLYLGESKGTIAKYGIDTDVSLDSNLNGNPADDIDNKGTDSSVNGNVFVIKSSDVTAKEKTMRLSLYDSNNTVIGTKDIKIVYDFVTSPSAESLSESADTLPKDISEIDKVNLEKLKDLIRGAKEQDRLKMMQYFSSLQENWFDTREKTKTIIDFETYIDSGSSLDVATKDSFYSLLEGFLFADTQVKDDVGLATKVLKSLIPKTNSSYDQIIKNIDDIISHPTNTTLNKELGTFILNAVKDDADIEVKDKNIIKSQLQTIIYGGQNNIPENIPAVESTSSSGILDFLLGFGKVLGFIFLGLLGLIIAIFVYFKLFNKDSNLGFQDFIIDKISGKESPEEISYVPPVVTETVSPKKEEEIPQTDVLANIVSDNQSIVIPESSDESVTTLSVSSVENATIPDWLKESTSLVSHTNTEEEVTSEKTPASEKTPVPASVPEEVQVDTTSVPENLETPVVTSDVPDWLKGMETPVVTPATLPEETIIMKEEKTSTVEQTDNSGLPPWMQGVDQESLDKEVEEEIKNTPTAEKTKESSSYEDIPDWLKSAPTLLENTNTASEETSSEASTEASEPEQKQSTPKKQSKTIKIKKEQSTDSSDTKKETSPSKPKKKKPESVVSPGPVISANPDELPDWLK